MRKLFNEFFYIPKHGKIREKVMLTRLTMTITIVIMCLAALSITAYAYFSYNVTSGSNIIKAANFEANVSITITDSNNDPVSVTKDGKVQTANLDAGEYTVLLTKGASTAKTGFCIITIDDTDYYTQQIGIDVGRNLTDGSASVVFTLKVSSTTEIEIFSHWGTSSCYGYEDTNDNSIYIKSGDVIDLTDSTDSNDETPSTEGQGTTENTTNTEPTTTPSTETTPPTTENTTPPVENTPPSEQTTPPETTGTSEPTGTTEPGTSTTEPTTTRPAETTQTETPGPETTEQPQSVTENTETTGAPTTEASE